MNVICDLTPFENNNAAPHFDNFASAMKKPADKISSLFLRKSRFVEKNKNKRQIKYAEKIKQS